MHRWLDCDDRTAIDRVFLLFLLVVCLWLLHRLLPPVDFSKTWWPFGWKHRPSLSLPLSNQSMSRRQQREGEWWCCFVVFTWVLPRRCYCHSRQIFGDSMAFSMFSPPLKPSTSSKRDVKTAILRKHNNQSRVESDGISLLQLAMDVMELVRTGMEGKHKWEIEHNNQHKWFVLRNGIQ